MSKTFKTADKSGVVMMHNVHSVYNMVTSASGSKRKMFRLVGTGKDGRPMSRIVSEATAMKYGKPVLKKAAAKKAPVKKAGAKAPAKKAAAKAPAKKAGAKKAGRPSKASQCSKVYDECMSSAKVTKAVATVKKSAAKTVKDAADLQKAVVKVKKAVAKGPGRPKGSKNAPKAGAAKRPVGRPPGSGAKKAPAKKKAAAKK